MMHTELRNRYKEVISSLNKIRINRAEGFLGSEVFELWDKIVYEENEVLGLKGLRSRRFSTARSVCGDKLEG
ncbi:hypothetical protein CHS0354_008163 [Potamilus streckersoni]|uniref:Uncharacterized protein n=1 Tax=Potamilus streckersoni TaxID=2493646 RepID=A0AAE0SIZ7_9BIVA|nr:hypothetical protein CHS0354_008163 [Potamilus streckersoni]